MTEFSGGCHCGALAVLFATSAPANSLGARFCGCSFCRKQGARYVSDPEGRAVIEQHAPNRLTRYRFGHRTADFLMCATCGVYLGAACRIDNRDYAVLNLNVFGDGSLNAAAAQTMNYDDESTEQRLARRAERWTPLEMREG